jgi:hypothetical protein
MSRFRGAVEYISHTISLTAVEIPLLLNLSNSPFQFSVLLLHLLDRRVGLLLLFLSSLTESRRCPCIARALLVS